MTDQLVLIDTSTAQLTSSNNVWLLDEATCEIGRRGVASARKALHAARDIDTDSIAADMPIAA